MPDNDDDVADRFELIKPQCAIRTNVRDARQNAHRCMMFNWFVLASPPHCSNDGHRSIYRRKKIN